jgi:carbon starvation protein CstA
MKTIIFFLVGTVLAVIFSLATIAVIRKSFREIVEELCGAPQRAAYWVRVSEVCLIVITIFAAITFHSYRSLDQPDNIALFWSLMSQAARILAAVFLSLIVISLVVLRSLPHRTNQIEPGDAGALQRH